MPGNTLRTREHKTEAAEAASLARSDHKVCRGAVERPSTDRKKKKKRTALARAAEYEAYERGTIEELKQVVMLTCSEAIKDELRRTQTNDPEQLVAYLLCPHGGMGTQDHGRGFENGWQR